MFLFRWDCDVRPVHAVPKTLVQVVAVLGKTSEFYTLSNVTAKFKSTHHEKWRSSARRVGITRIRRLDVQALHRNPGSKYSQIKLISACMLPMLAVVTITASCSGSTMINCPLAPSAR